MRKLSSYYFRTFSLVISFFLLVSVSSAFQNEPESFRGIKWGTNIADLSEMMIVKDAGQIKMCIKKDDKMKIGDADLERVFYVFYKDRFYSVSITFKNLKNYLKIKETLRELYGNGDRSNQFMEDYSWFGNAIYINLEFNEILKEGRVYYLFYPIKAEKDADMKEKAKKGVGDL